MSMPHRDFWTSRVGVSKLKLNLRLKIEDCRTSFAGIFNLQFGVEFQSNFGNF